MGGNDDFCGYRSSLDFIAEAGEPFLVMVHGYFGDQVQFNLTTELLLTAQDSCADAYSISVGETVRGDIGIGFVSGFPTCDDVENDPYSSDVFYRFVAPAPGVYEIETCSDTFIYPADTKISVYSGSCDDPVCVVANDDAGGNCGLGSLVNINAVEEGKKTKLNKTEQNKTNNLSKPFSFPLTYICSSFHFFQGNNSLSWFMLSGDTVEHSNCLLGRAWTSARLREKLLLVLLLLETQKPRGCLTPSLIVGFPMILCSPMFFFALLPLKASATQVKLFFLIPPLDSIFFFFFFF